MPKARVPGWWLAVGANRAMEVQDLFSQVMNELPMPHGELAESLQVSPSTVWRWKKGEATPSIETMKKAVQEVLTELDRQLQRATAMKEVLDLVAAIKMAQQADDQWKGGQEQAEQLASLLDQLDN